MVKPTALEPVHTKYLESASKLTALQLILKPKPFLTQALQIVDHCGYTKTSFCDSFRGRESPGDSQDQQPEKRLAPPSSMTYTNPKKTTNN